MRVDERDMKTNSKPQFPGVLPSTAATFGLAIGLCVCVGAQ